VTLQQLKVGDIAYLVNYSRRTARKLGVVERIRDGVTIAGPIGNYFDPHSNAFVNGRWYRWSSLYSEESCIWIGYRIEDSND
jgi:hypothetical protein